MSGVPFHGVPGSIGAIAVELQKTAHLSLVDAQRAGCTNTMRASDYANAYRPARPELTEREKAFVARVKRMMAVLERELEEENL